MRRAPLVLLLCCTLGLTACARSSPAGAGGPSTTPTASGAQDTPGSAAPSGSASTAPSTRPPTSKPPADPPAARPSGIPSGGRDNNTMPLTVTLDRSCYLTGQTLVAEIETLPGASIGMTVAYPDNSIVPDYQFVSKDENTSGSYTWRFAIRSTIKGWSYVSTVTSKDDRSAVYDAPFRIATTC